MSEQDWDDDDLADVALITLETPPDGLEIELGEVVTVVSVQASNLVKDVRELITNALGGRMRRYERLLELTLETAMARYRRKLRSMGYDGALGVRIAHPTLVQGGAEIIVYGTGFRRRPSAGLDPAAPQPPEQRGENPEQ